MKSTARRAGRVLFSGVGRRDIATNTANMRKEYLMNDTDLKWNRKREKYQKMMAEYRAKGGIVSRLPTTLERREHRPTFSFDIAISRVLFLGRWPRQEERRRWPVLAAEQFRRHDY